jgi:NAD(P)-dependent dehydrogenase (short-subunit alcohol dehydrogenase family)
MATSAPQFNRAMEAVVFGGPEWLARPIVDHLASRDLRVTFIGKNPGTLGNANVLRWDPRSIRELEDTIARLNRRDVTHLVHVQTPTAPSPFLSISPEEWNSAAGENLTSGYLLCHHLLPSMIERSFGRIAFVSSLVGRTGAALRARDSSVQAGILGLCRVVALEVASFNVTANVVSVLDLSQTSPPESLHRPAVRPDDVVHACGLVLTDQSSFLTGQEIRVTGGQPLW